LMAGGGFAHQEVREAVFKAVAVRETPKEAEKEAVYSEVQRAAQRIRLPCSEERDRGAWASTWAFRVHAAGATD
jgi:hypothetical protein